MIPTADEAARIIVAAFRECRADPLLVNASLRGAAFHPTGPKARAMDGRRYAALAMRQLFPACRSGAIGRMVGCRGDADAFLGELTRDIAKGKASWFDPDVLKRVTERAGIAKSAPVQREVDETRTHEPPPVQLSTPFYTRPRAKRALEEELRRAVENTQRMTPRS